MIFIIDLDGTIIGDCSYQVEVYNLEKILKSNNIKNKKDNLLISSYNQESKLIRPYYSYFHNKIRKNIKNSKIYIYTASEKSWALKEISMIEKTHNIKFDRPIFTRNDCIIDSDNNYKKSVKKILPKILKRNKDLTIENIKNSLKIIDNNEVFIDYLDKFILCPSYNYIHFCNLIDKIKYHNLLNNENKEIKKYINNLIITNKLCNNKHKEHKEDEINFKWLYKKHKKINKINDKYKSDDFWKKLTKDILQKL